jgi:hypothetical protein
MGEEAQKIADKLGLEDLSDTFLDAHILQNYFLVPVSNNSTSFDEFIYHTV